MTLIDQHTGVIQQLCARHKVRRLYAFGSVLTDQFNKDSDVDLVVDFEPQEVSQYADKIVDTRNRIIHGYDTVSDEIIWSMVNDHMPILRQEVERLLS